MRRYNDKKEIERIRRREEIKRDLKKRRRKIIVRNELELRMKKRIVWKRKISRGRWKKVMIMVIWKEEEGDRNEKVIIEEKIREMEVIEELIIGIEKGLVDEERKGINIKEKWGNSKGMDKVGGCKKKKESIEERKKELIVKSKEEGIKGEVLIEGRRKVVIIKDERIED